MIYWQYDPSILNKTNRFIHFLGQNFTRSANPYHNAQTESLMKTLKVEEIYLVGDGKFDDVTTRLPYFNAAPNSAA
jgi:hypothetical protein